MAGTDARFDAAAFRSAIRFAMTMGLPEASEQQATFRWNVQRTFAQADSSGDPWSWAQTASASVSYDDMRIPVAVQYTPGQRVEERIGGIDPGKAVLTVLDEDYDTLTASGRPFPNQVQLGDAIFDIQFVSPPQGLFDVTIYEVHCRAIDEAAS